MTTAPQTQTHEDSLKKFAGVSPQQVQAQADPEQRLRLEEFVGEAHPPPQATEPNAREEEGATSHHAYGHYRATGGGLGVEFFLPGGAVQAVSYGQIAMVGTNPEGNTLTIQCQLGVVLRLTGQNLAPIRSGLMRHRVAFVKAPAQGPGDVAVQDITLEYPSADNLLLTT